MPPGGRACKGGKELAKQEGKWRRDDFIRGILGGQLRGGIWVGKVIFNPALNLVVLIYVTEQLE
jgi:hypothetical protein